MATHPSPRDRLVVSLLAVAQHYLGHNTVSEHDQDEGAQELGEGLSQHVTDAWPCQSGI
jgi:hypothetical protein